MKGMHIVMWFFVGAILVLVLTHAQSFATAVHAVGQEGIGAGSLLAGYAPQSTGPGGYQFGKSTPSQVAWA